MKIKSLLYTLLISFNLMAADNGTSRLSYLLDEFQYSMTVEWDQKDKKELEKITGKLETDLKKLVEEEGMTKDEIKSFLLTKVSNKKMIEDLEIRFSHMSEKLTSSELLSIVREYNSSMYSQGASWSGDVIIAGSLAAGFIISLILVIYYIIHKDDQSCEKLGGYTVENQVNCGIRIRCIDKGENYCYQYEQYTGCDTQYLCMGI